MISFIVCSINPQLIEDLKTNVKKSIGDVEYEFIVFDNRQESLRITKVYNMCAQKAKYDHLCFLHEDVLFATDNWGEKIIQHLSTPNCGAIGFAGAVIKSKAKSPWGQMTEFNRVNYIQHTPKGVTHHNNIPSNIELEPVITLDGLCIFCKKSVWEECQFDENLLTGFHCYDVDFTLQTAQNYHNYICNSINIEHLSAGSHNTQWVYENIKLHDKKWGDKLPMYVGDIPKRLIAKNENAMEFIFMKHIIKSQYGIKKTRSMLSAYIKRHKMRNSSTTLYIKLLQYRYILR